MRPKACSSVFYMLFLFDIMVNVLEMLLVQISISDFANPFLYQDTNMFVEENSTYSPYD
jgi:hypothetical protein